MNQETTLIILMASGGALFIFVSLLVDSALSVIERWRRK